MSKPLYVSRHWSVREWDCLKRSRNEYAWDNEHGRLCTNDENTANLFKVLDTLRDWNKGWVVNTTRAGYKSGYRTPAVNKEVGGAANSWHTKGCAADIHNAMDYNASATALFNTVMDAARAHGLEGKINVGLYHREGWVHIEFVFKHTGHWDG